MGLLLTCSLKLSIMQLLCLVVLAHDLITKPQIDAIYQFGDSLSDTGNGLSENPTNLCTKLPHGETFFHRATGRCCNGRIMADFYATAFGLPFLNPYLEREADFSNGADFSVSGATALDAAYLATMNVSVTATETNSSLSVQLEWFRNHLKSICSSTSECKQKLETSLFLMEAIGGNDYVETFSADKSFQFAYQLVPDVIRAVMDGVKDLILLGAVNVVVPGIVPLGCLPSILVQFNLTDPKMYDEIGCAKGLNEFSKFYNLKLQEAKNELQLLYPNTTLIFADYYSAIWRVLENPTSYGFEEDKELVACCGYGENPYNFDLSYKCGSSGARLCPNPNKMINWDGFHYTQRMYELVSDWMLQHTIIPQLTLSSFL